MDSFRLASASARVHHVFLRDMVLLASVGVHGFEHEMRQRVRINVDLAVADNSQELLSRAPPAKDDLTRVVDYEAVADRIRVMVSAGHVQLVETLAERIAEACLKDLRVRSVHVRVEKLDIFADIASVGVEIERRAIDRAGI